MNKLTSTSALVLLWSKGHIHKSGLSTKYLTFLNLDSAKKLHFKCNQIWPHYSEVIKNRKRCVLDLAQMGISDGNVLQIIILGAGMDPLSLEIISKKRNLKIFEIDSSTNQKKSIVKKIDKTILESLSLICEDLKNSKAVLKSLRKHGWNPKIPTLVIAEGISYYLSEEDLYNILNLFHSKNKKNYVVLEYLLSDELIFKNRASIAKKIFDLISIDIDLQRITRYDQAKIKEMIDNLKGEPIKQLNLKEMELQRKGKNVYFKRRKSGWIEICYFSL